VTFDELVDATGDPVVADAALSLRDAIERPGGAFTGIEPYEGGGVVFRMADLNGAGDMDDLAAVDIIVRRSVWPVS
jgi:hypothetical protein